MNAIESFIGSLGILLGGFVTIPLVGRMYGVKINWKQAVKMSITFFFLRWIWLFSVREFFS